MRNLILVLLLCIATVQLKANNRWLFDLETGQVFAGYNVIRIPENVANTLSPSAQLSAINTPFYRLKLGYSFGGSRRHTLLALYAPLSMQFNGNLPADISFNEQAFAANTNVNLLYRFNSYRLTYRYTLLQTKHWQLGAGITAKIRDAEIMLSSNTQKTSSKNVGFVPLINFLAVYNLNGKLGALFEADALMASQGRAEDCLLAATYSINSNLTLKGGYRLLEGGAKNSAVYTFSAFHYALLGVTARF